MNGQLRGDHFFQLAPAGGHLAALVMPAAELQVVDLIVRDIQHGYQRNLFLFALRLRLIEQHDGLATFDKALTGEKCDLVEIVIPQASGVMAGHDVVLRLVLWQPQTCLATYYIFKR